ncbi:polysaccharide ABC transporter ATP-binding protein [Gryllotalpicola reticulitermitis]|uniref:Polysaccharide ABC transporter ATP-binding protein n=1 Tax=Gryllotalpicola reticulitermitis TaxID=1184153 RepID=A0ABV8Q7R1_9MICO
MFDTDYAVRVQGIGKTYRLGTTQTRASTLAETMLSRLRSSTRQRDYSTFDALDDISFEIPRGSALGIVGRNGAGKSTLLKILTRVTAPTRGRIDFRGRMGSLLEVGTGFHPELTGRENIFLNGALLGMNRAEILRQFDAIVDFSGMERFLETPVKRYSSGMYVRLAFSVAAHLETEILAIDEVLAVGDAEFQRKSLEKMREAANQGRTVLYVSHMLQTVKTLCDSAILLERGHLVHSGTVDSTLTAYSESFDRYAADQLDPSRRQGSGGIRFDRVWMDTDHFASGDAFDVSFQLPAAAEPLPVQDYWVSGHIVDDGGTVIAQCDSRLNDVTFDSADPHRGRLTIKNLWLKPGKYSVDMFACQRSDILDSWDAAIRFEVIPEWRYRANATVEAASFGVVLADFEYEME